MLQALRIQNFALIQHVELNFNAGYTVITGETGSGKSILLAALNLILGERADYSVIGNSSDKAIVEADFSLNGFQLEDFFRENDLDFEALTLIRREIHTSGKSRAFINDTPVSLSTLKDLTSQLINIHSQYNTLELKSKSYQLDVLDTLADLMEERTHFAKQYKLFSEQKAMLEHLNSALENDLKQQDYNQFQLEELHELALDKTKYAQLEAELLQIENSEGILNALTAFHTSIEDDQQVLDLLRLVKINAEKVKHLSPEVNNLNERLNSVLIELADISAEAATAIEAIETNPEKLAELTAQLNKYYHVLKKHNAKNEADLLAIQRQLEGQLSTVEETQQRIHSLTESLRQLETSLQAEALSLHDKRLKAAQLNALALQEILVELKLPHTTLDFHLTPRETFNSYGLTDISLLFSANIGIETVPIEKAASGGELSRVMLALQKLISEKRTLPTVLFDEIDTGVSGDVAQKIGALLQKMGTNFQLFAISHLPQVAAKAAHHYKVEKEVVDGRTTTRVASLSHDDRIFEIARLMSGEEITAAAIQNAKNLMN